MLLVRVLLAAVSRRKVEPIKLRYAIVLSLYLRSLKAPDVCVACSIVFLGYAIVTIALHFIRELSPMLTAGVRRVAVSFNDRV